MRIGLYDLETNGFLHETSKIHSLVVKDYQTKEIVSCADQEGYTPIKEGIELLTSFDAIVAHNELCFDGRVLEKLYPSIKLPKELDSLNMSRLIWSDMMERDSALDQIPKNFRGKHSLASWGHRLKNYKTEYTGGFDRWSEEMQDYCVQDVEVLDALWTLIESKNYSNEAMELEYDFQKIIHQQEMNGVPFDIKKAQALYYELREAEEKVTEELKTKVPIYVKSLNEFTPKRNNKPQGYRQGASFTKIEIAEFKPTRNNMLRHLIKDKGWTPIEFTDKGNPKLGSEQLEGLEKHIPIAADFKKFFDLQKAKSRLLNKEGNGWIKEYRNGRIFGRVNTNGAVTGRCTHSIIANVPRVSSYKGEEIRSLFTSGRGFMVGADAAQLELRLFAHFLAAWDNGAYRDILLEGDIHTANQHAAGLSSRDDAKTFIYAFIYGAGDQKLGSIVDPLASADRQKKIGRELRQRFYRNFPAINALITSVKKASERGFLKGLDGRFIPVRASYMALNTLLQGAGAVVMKKATVLQWDLINSYPIQGVHQAINMHDENQLIVDSENMTLAVGRMMVQAIVNSGEHFNLRCPLDGEYKIGRNWAETH